MSQRVGHGYGNVTARVGAQPSPATKGEALFAVGKGEPLPPGACELRAAAGRGRRIGSRPAFLTAQAGDSADATRESATAGARTEVVDVPAIPALAARLGDDFTGRLRLARGIFFKSRTNAFKRFFATLAAFFACLYALRARL